MSVFLTQCNERTSPTELFGPQSLDIHAANCVSLVTDLYPKKRGGAHKPSNKFSSSVWNVSIGSEWKGFEVLVAC